MRERVEVRLGARSYAIEIGDGVLDDPRLIAGAVGGQAMIVTNETIAPLYLERVRRALAGRDVDVCILPDGEAHKTLATYETVVDALLARRHGRATTVVALGGGVIGDIAGFVAATYQRGVALVQVPTTLLAQVDSSVGGKTAVNRPLGKNMIGAFHQPRLVVADTSVLGTLPDREYRAGLAEVIKYGVIRDRAFFDWLCDSTRALRARDPDALRAAIKRCCEVKADVVAADEREDGERAILNYGHTFGHALETLTGYEILHGEAVAIGMVMAADLARRAGMLGSEDAKRIREAIFAFDLPVTPPGNLGAAQMIELMLHDKKVKDGRVRFVLPRAIGRVEITDRVAPECVEATLRAGRGLCRD